eukprot:CAMPEP_0198666194 /NCGR_PEP_ID=MMETSP1467-20131203/63673_1 /TAXON_ID=1462469 /ORGANISM="unid. sp., Strain CCMP2135" /LENGTH=537 /DNA_ID=CAMNT_0044402833 /DNA_START=370 /DNA_END=1984 /DNA_ORIENTATION=+
MAEAEETDKKGSPPSSTVGVEIQASSVGAQPGLINQTHQTSEDVPLAADAKSTGIGSSGGESQILTRELKRYNVMGVRFDVDVRYNVLDVVGQGAYGVVCAAHDEERDESVAIKKIFNPFEHTTCAKRTLREIRLLRLLQHENIIKLRTLLPPVRADGFKDLYIILDLMETDLASVIKSPQPLSDDHIQFFLYQVLRGVKFLHTSTPAITHRDLKPRNLLVNSNCDLKICDFGLARIDYEHDVSIHSKAKAMTDYVATRWYRAPEIMLGAPDYTKAIDMWAVGCILAELLGRKPLWPGSDSKHQLGLICQCIGKPNQTTIDRIQHPEIRAFVDSIPQHALTIAFADLYPDGNPKACAMLQRLLVFDPEFRVDVEHALCDPYLDQLHFPDDEPRGPDIPLDAFEFETLGLGVEQLRDEILREINCYHSENKMPSNIGDFGILATRDCSARGSLLDCQPLPALSHQQEMFYPPDARLSALAATLPATDNTTAHSAIKPQTSTTTITTDEARGSCLHNDNDALSPAVDSRIDCRPERSAL